MKKLFLAVAALAVLTPAFGAGYLSVADADNYFSVGTTNPVSALSWGIVSARSQNAGTPIVTVLSYATDKASSSVYIYNVVSETACTFTNTTVSIPVATTNTAGNPTWGSGYCIIRHMLTDQYEKRAMATSGGLTNLQVSAAPLETVVPGDKIYLVSTNNAGAIQIGLGAIGTNTITGNQIFVGQKGKPLLIEVLGTSSATMGLASGYYAP